MLLLLRCKKLNLATFDGLTAEQRFFLGYTQMHRKKSRNESVKIRMNNNPHSPAEWRINGTLSQMKEFKEAFNLPYNCPMVRP